VVGEDPRISSDEQLIILTPEADNQKAMQTEDSPEQYYDHIHKETCAIKDEARMNCKHAVVSGILSPDSYALLRQGFEKVYQVSIPTNESGLPVVEVNGVRLVMLPQLEGITCITAYRELTL